MAAATVRPGRVVLARDRQSQDISPLSAVQRPAFGAGPATDRPSDASRATAERATGGSSPNPPQRRDCKSCKVRHSSIWRSVGCRGCAWDTTCRSRERFSKVWESRSRPCASCITSALASMPAMARENSACRSSESRCTRANSSATAYRSAAASSGPCREFSPRLIASEISCGPAALSGSTACPKMRLQPSDAGVASVRDLGAALAIDCVVTARPWQDTLFGASSSSGLSTC